MVGVCSPGDPAGTVPRALFRNGRNQALPIPRGWEFDADEALLRREGGVLTVVPVPREGLLPWLATLGPLDVSFPDVGDAGLLPLDERVASMYAGVRLRLERAGTPIGPSDLWIAAHALAEERVVVTGHGREFGRVAGLGVVDWREAGTR